MRRLAHLFLPALLPLALVAPTARAALPDEIQVYVDDVRAPGESGVELHVNTTPSGRSTPDYPGEVPPDHGLRVTPEISLGLAPNWDAGVYLPFLHSGAGSSYFAGPRFRLKWVPLRPTEGGSGWFAGTNEELSFVKTKFEESHPALEVRPILGWRDARWLAAVNPVVEFALGGPDRGWRPDFSPAFKLARNVTRDVALGFEYYAELGPLGQTLPHSEQAHTLYFAIDTEKPIGLNFGIGRGLTGAADRWTVKAIFDISF